MFFEADIVLNSLAMIKQNEYKSSNNKSHKKEIRQKKRKKGKRESETERKKEV